jgi:hypothetical protein
MPSSSQGTGASEERQQIENCDSLHAAVSGSMMERRFPTGDRHVRYNRLNYFVYHGTIFSSIKSTRRNKCCQVYATDFCWSRNFSIKASFDAHHDFFHQDGVPMRLISDIANELTLGEFARTARHAQCPIDLTDTYCPWQNRAESEIELEWLSGRWLEREAQGCFGTFVSRWRLL